VDPRDLFNQVRSDFESNRWTAFVLAGILVLGLAAWGSVYSTRALSPRATTRRAIPDRPQISVLPDPFADRQQ
jgi:CHASE1-domain containing sensor protein